jgi:hypothetical protein
MEIPELLAMMDRLNERLEASDGTDLETILTDVCEEATLKKRGINGNTERDPEATGSA